MSDTTTLSINGLSERVEAIFRRAGLNAVQSGALARVITAGERDACKSHGIYRIEGALRTVKAGKVKPNAVPEITEDDGTAIVKVNANGGFANPAFELGLPVLAERAKRLGIAALAINDCTHFSALWPEVEGLTENGLAGLVMCPLPSAGRAGKIRLMSLISPHPLPHAAKLSCTGARANNCPKAGPSTPRATRRPTRKPPLPAPCCRLAATRDRQSAP